MKKVILIMLVLGWALLSGAQQQRIDATIPFDFFLNDQSLPAGPYHFDWTMDHRIKVTPQTTGESPQFVLISELDVMYKGDQPTIVFHKLANQYFFREILHPGLARIIAPVSKLELRSRQQIAQEVKVPADQVGK